MTAPALQMPREFPATYRAPYDPQVSPELVEEVKGMSSTLKESLRHQAENDRYFLASGILGYADVNPYTHGPYIKALEDKSKKRRMFLMHRGSLKSTIGTIVDSVAEGLANPEECRILIVNEVEENAIGFLSEIKAHFENNELLHELYPELIPKRFGGPGSRWSTHKACLPRKTAYKEWTWRAVGVGSAIVSQHYTRIKFDDVIGFEARQSPAAMKYATDYVKAIESQLVNMDEDIVDWNGTRWAIFDVYREVLSMYGEDMAYFAREDIEMVPEDASDELLLAAGFKGDLDKIRGTLQPIFPRKFSLKSLHRLSVIDPVLYYAQYKNNPIADGIKDFNANAIQYFDFDYSGNVVYRDPKTGILRRWPRESLDVVMACDPNSGELTSTDLPAIVVAAYSPEDQIFVFDSWARRVLPDTYTERIYDMWEQWQPRVVGIEKAGQQTVNFYFKKLAKERKQFINVAELKPKNRDKATRIRRGLAGVINQGNLYCRKHQTTLVHQVRFHPDLDNDDEIDGLEYTTELFIRPDTQEETEAADAAVKKVMQARNKVSGY